MFSPEFSDFYQNTFFVENLCVAGIDLPFLIELKNLSFDIIDGLFYFSALLFTKWFAEL